MSDYADYSVKTTKDCSVILERLDEKLLNHYVKKYGIKITTIFRSLESKKLKSDCSETHKCPYKIQQSKNPEESITESGVIQKKKKTKALCYSDDEECSKNLITKEKSSALPHKEGNKRATDDPGQSLKNSKSTKPKLKKVRRLKKTCEISEMATIKSKEGITEVERRRNNSTSKSNLNESFCKSFFTEPDSGSGLEDSGIEIIEKNNFHLSGRVNFNPSVTNSLQCDKKLLSYKNESAEAKHLEEGEYDSREDSEDDKSTVIFEESNKDTEPEIFEIDGCETELSGRKLTNKEITNRKKPRLIKFKRKSIAGRNSATMRKPETKLIETWSPGKEITEAETSFETVSEDCLKEVCNLVKRLHELHKIILQQKSFFKELPNKDELFVHFSKVITAQQENFQKEIRKSQKIIIKCYENMLFRQKPNEVALEISKRASLNVDEVIYVLSQCFLVEGACEVEKSKSSSVEKEIFQSQKPSYSLENLHKTNMNECLIKTARRTVQKTNYSSHPLPSENSVELIKSLPNELLISCRLPTRENLMSYSQSSSGRAIKGPLPPLEHQKRWVEYEKPKPRWISKYTVQKPHSQAPKDSKIGQAKQGLSQINPRLEIRHLFPHSANPRGEINGFTYPNQIVRPSLNYPANVGLPQRSNLPLCSFTPVKDTVFPMHNSEKPINCSARGNTQISSFNSKVPIVPIGAGNNASLSSVSHQNNFQNILPSRTYKGMANSQKQVLTPSHETRCPLEVIFMDSMRQARLPNELLINLQGINKKQCNYSSSGTISRNGPRGVFEKKVLDPTIPQKLTMKNYRLQAEPIIGLQTKTQLNNKVNLSSEEEKIDCDDFPNSDQDSKSRVYICAQNDCKKPGTRICKGCESIIYCSETCQLKHWNEKHKAECHQLKELRG